MYAADAFFDIAMHAKQIQLKPLISAIFDFAEHSKMVPGPNIMLRKSKFGREGKIK